MFFLIPSLLELLTPRLHLFTNIRFSIMFCFFNFILDSHKHIGISFFQSRKLELLPILLDTRLGHVGFPHERPSRRLNALHPRKVLRLEGLVKIVLLLKIERLLGRQLYFQFFPLVLALRVVVLVYLL